MDFDEKRFYQQRVQAHFKKHKTLAEQKQIKEAARKKRAERKSKTRERWQPDAQGADEGFEKLRRSFRQAARHPESAKPDSGLQPGDTQGPAPGTREEAEVSSVARNRIALNQGGARLWAAPALNLELAVGDRVWFERRAGDLLLLRGVLPRKSYLARPDPGTPSRRRLLACNVDLVLCVVAARNPAFKAGFIDRVLLAAEEGAAQVLIVLNKIDLVSAEERRELERSLDEFRGLGQAVLAVSAATGEGLAALSASTAGQTCVFVGHSGVGKSSLLNGLEPLLARQTGAVRLSDGKGRHTTTASELIELGNGARLIDTPGVRQFGLYGLAPLDLELYFPELRELAPACRFRDCAHLAEPDCAVKRALAEGQLNPRRFDSYRRIRASLE